ncbi:MAG: hypothetical protein KDF54_06515 [Hydrogenophaga sp.]|nr:hypothetical protein [Hydrogenophaga sp.]
MRVLELEEMLNVSGGCGSRRSSKRGGCGGRSSGKSSGHCGKSSGKSSGKDSGKSCVPCTPCTPVPTPDPNPVP